ncbi:hypothetical protein Tco_1521642 [Tanacetum coccineum]
MEWRWFRLTAGGGSEVARLKMVGLAVGGDEGDDAGVWGGDDGDDNEGRVMVGCGGEASDKGDRVDRVTRNIFGVGRKSFPAPATWWWPESGGGGAARNIEGEERAFVCCVCVFLR